MRKAENGVIINISSFLGKMGLPLLARYNASKYAVEGIVDSLRFETLPFNVRVHSIQSGLFGTNFVAKAINEGPSFLRMKIYLCLLVVKLKLSFR